MPFTMGHTIRKSWSDVALRLHNQIFWNMTAAHITPKDADRPYKSRRAEDLGAMRRAIDIAMLIRADL